MTSVNLRKGNELERGLLEVARRFNVTPTTLIDIYQDDEAVRETIDSTLDANRSTVYEAVSIIQAAHSIRSAISRANSTSGINDLLTTKAALDAEEKFLSGLGLGDGTLFRSASGSKQVPVEMALRRLESARARYNSTENHYGASESVTVSVIPDDLVERINSRLAEIKMEKRDISDKILSANLETKFALTETTVSILTKYNLLKA